MINSHKSDTTKKTQEKPKQKNRVGLIIGSFKPYTKGHNDLVVKSAEENNKTILFISESDRMRPGEISVTWETMSKIWEDFIYQILPSSVEPVTTKNPFTSLYNYLKTADNNKDKNIIYTLYLGGKDVKRYELDGNKIKLKFPFLFDNNLLIIKAIGIKLDIDISATKMRAYIQKNEFKTFRNGLPEPLRVHAVEIFKALSIA
jgi:hypothetical protein